MTRFAGWVAWVVLATGCSSPMFEERGKHLSLDQSVPLMRGDIAVKGYRVSRAAGANPLGLSATLEVDPSRPCLGELDGGFTCSEDAASGITIDARFLDGTTKRAVFENCDANAACNQLVQLRLRVEEAPYRPVRAEFALRLRLGPGTFADSSGLSIVPE
jgi:hypothetical protein